MVHIINFLNGLNTKRKLYRYKRAKNISEQLDKNQRPNVSVIDRGYYCWVRYVKCGFIKEKFRAYKNNKLMFWLAKQYYAFWTDGTFSNYMVKSILGFVGGVLLTYLAFIFLVVPMNFHVFNSWYLSLIFMLILPLGLAFSMIIRCIVLCMLPQLFTRQGRQALMAYAYILLLTGPTRNIIYNSAIFTESLTCTQEQLKAAARNITEIVMRPLRSLRNTLIEVMKSVRHIISRVKDGLVYLKDKIVEIVKYMQHAMDWLVSSNNLCNEKLGTPKTRCYRHFWELGSNCKQSISSVFWIICDLTTVISKTCEGLAPIDFYCDFIEYVDKNIFSVIRTKLRDFMRYIKTMFYVSISFNHSYSFETNQSKTLRQVAKDVVYQVEGRLSFFFFIFRQLAMILSTYLFYIIFRTIVYWYAFLTYDWYDNHYINRHLRELDMMRSSAGYSTLFPLTAQEKANYVGMWSFRLSLFEKKLLFSDLGFMLKSTAYFLIHFFVDISIYWVLTLIAKHGNISVDIGLSTIDLQSKGSGFLATLYLILSLLLKPYAVEVHFSTYYCLPHPIPTDFVKYQQIAAIMIIVWFMVVFEPFGLRMRNETMTFYNPDAGQRRSVWLFNYIQQARISILTYVRKQVNRKASFGLRDDSSTIIAWIIYKCPPLWYCCPYKDKADNCILCQDRTVAAYKCITPECKAAYCKKCLEQDGDKCALCRISDTLDAEDLSEESASEDESEDEPNEDEEAAYGQQNWTIISPTATGADSITYSATMEQETTYRTAKDGDTDIETRSTSRYYSIRDPTVTSFYSSQGADSTRITTSHQRDPRRYFTNPINQVHWASLDDFDLPVPNLYTWIRPR